MKALSSKLADLQKLYLARYLLIIVDLHKFYISIFYNLVYSTSQPQDRLARLREELHSQFSSATADLAERNCLKTT